MCPRCKYGPVENLNCSDLSAHHCQVMRAGAVAVNNSCPRCQYFSSDWSSWTDWDGRLPDETAGEWTATPSRPRVLCRHFARGACSRGSTCTFAHEGAVEAAPDSDASLRRQRTVPCVHFARGACSWGSACIFAHGPSQSVPVVRAAPSAIPVQGATGTVPCRHFARGFCSRGSTCTFAHGSFGRPAAVVPNEIASRHGPQGNPRRFVAGVHR
jgi:hypothetical protein